jgi:hypothetical protein
MKCIMKKIVVAFLLFAARAGISQTTVTNSGVLYISNNSDILYIESDFTNNAGAAFTNKGQFYVRGNLSNNEVGMAIGTGTLYINGSSTQSVGGGQTFRTLNFISNNAAGITLNNNLSVSGAHTFTSGIITTSATPNYLVYEAGSSYSGDGDASHVNGWVKKMGSTNFVFPVGNGTLERTVAINSLSATSEFNARYLANTPNRTSLQLPLRTVDQYGYWPITRTSGGTAKVTLNWDASKVYFPNYILADLVVSGWGGSLWVDNGDGSTVTGNAATTGSITSNTISTFNQFTFGSKSWVLPLTLLSFNATRQENHVLVEWKTEKEAHISHFIVERSDDGNSFYYIGRTNGRNSGNTESYQSIDNKSIQTIAYYRLRTKDMDGKETLSRVLTIVSGQRNNKLLLVGNPVRNKITLLATGTLTGDFNYQITSVNGQVVQSGKLPILNGGYYDINLNGTLKPGTYSLKVMDNMQAFNYKVLVF